MTGSISGWVQLAPGLKLLSSVEAVTSARHPDSGWLGSDTGLGKEKKMLPRML